MAQTKEMFIILMIDIWSSDILDLKDYGPEKKEDIDMF